MIEITIWRNNSKAVWTVTFKYDILILFPFLPISWPGPLEKNNFPIYDTPQQK